MINNPRTRTVKEFARVKLGDKRLNERALKVAQRLLSEPAAAFPDAMADEAELEALYRFANNEKVDLQSLLAPHVEATQALIGDRREVLAIHDTTECYFPGEASRLDVGFIGRRPGFLLHTALAVSADIAHAPLGVLGMIPIVRAKPQQEKKRGRSRNPKHRSNEGLRWRALVERTEKDALSGASLIHLMDREADVFRLLLYLIESGRRFVIRSYHDRLVSEDEHLSDALAALPLQEAGQRKVLIGARHNYANSRASRNHPSREQRSAKLAVRMASVRLRKPKHENYAAEFVDVSVVQVCEVDPPAGEKPIEWTLLTSEPVDTAEQAWRVVDHYCARWRIEEYFKALKSGCSFEKRQFENSDALLRILGLLAPIAWQLLALRVLARDDGDRPATQVLRPTQLAVLAALGRLPDNATAHQAMLAVARLGGHLKRNGPPGWLTLGRGIEKLDSYELGWIAAQGKM